MSPLRSRAMQFAPLIVLLFIAASLPAAAGSSSAVLPSRPGILDRFAGFAARIDYAGHRTDRANAPEIQGTAIIADGTFSLAERGPNYELRASGDGVTVRAGALSLHASDPLDADVLVNVWPIAVAALSRGQLTRRGATAWQTQPGIIVYTNENGTGIDGISGRDGARLAYTFAGWGDVGDALFPTRIVRLRNGVTDAIFQIDRLDVVRSGAPSAAQSQTSTRTVSGPAVGASAPSTITAPPAAMPFPWLSVLTSFGSLFLAIAIVAWLRRDAFSMSLCRYVTADGRAWRSSGTAAFVDSDGILHFEGNVYRVGADFFARSVEVQLSPLFLRVSAPGISKAVVLPRLLPRQASRRRRTAIVGAGARTSSAQSGGLSVVETLVAMALFAVVMVGAVYPALTAVARADHIAAQKRAAILAALNALTDEEMACAYGTSAPVGTSTQTVNGFTVTVNLAPSTLAGARDIRVIASDSSGLVLATLATTVGPPVPPPGSSSSAPSYQPVPPASAGDR